MLLPTLLNILLRSSATAIFRNTDVTVYGNDIVLQTNTHNLATKTLRKLKDICSSLGLVISLDKTKILRK